MNENILSAPDDIISSQALIDQMSGGAMLRMAREAVGLHIGALAVLLKVPVKKLEALETDRFDLLPDTVFVRALAASVCRTLKIDPSPILERLPHIAAPALKTDKSGINAPFRTSEDGLISMFLYQLSKPFSFVVVALLLGVVVLMFLPSKQQNKIVNALNPVTTAVNLPRQAPMSVPIAAENSAIVKGSIPNLSAGSVSPGLVAPSAQNQAAVNSTTSAPVSVLSALPKVGAGSIAATSLVVLKAHQSSWVEVVDASGVVQLRKIMADGEIIGVSGVMPLSVVVGRVDTTEVLVRGKPFDLTRIAKDNVARFEVK